MQLHELTYLVVDDLELMRAVTVNQLRALGCEKVKVARNGATALEMLRKGNIDVVLCDWNMPVMSGLDLLRAVRADPALARLPFLMITAEAERQRIEEVIHAGVSGLLVKPYNAGNLRNRLERVLTQHQRGVVPTVRNGANAGSAAGSVPPPRRRSTDAPLAPSRILLVDDDARVLASTLALFKDDFQVVTASDGAAALAQCQSEQVPDLLISDVQMPGMDGLELVSQLRQRPQTAQIPVIFVTGSDDEATRRRGMELGAVDFVEKTADPATLRAKVRNFLKLIDRHRQLQADFDAMQEAALLREDVEHTTRHDIKGALAGVVGMVHSLAEDPDMNPRHAGQLRLVERTAQQAIDLVNLSSELYKIETGHYNLQAAPVDLGDVLHRIVDVARVTFADKRLTIEVDTDTPVGTELPQALGDANLCYSLFQNLVKNACEAAPPDTRVSVTLKDEKPLRVVIGNRGVVPAGLRDRFFDKFATSGKSGGSGIGTYSAMMLARAQGGDIQMHTSDESNRTDITVTLPRHTFQGDFVDPR